MLLDPRQDLDMRTKGARENVGREFTTAKIAQRRFVDGLTNQEIADEIGCGLTHVETVVRELVKESTAGITELLAERRVAWLMRIEYLWRELKGKLDFLGTAGAPVDDWLGVVKQMLALSALATKIEGSCAAAGPKSNNWLLTDVESMSDQQVIEEARLQGIRIPEKPKQLT